ncbi:hypothetical protein [Streptomyces sp. NPDC023838]|uniref:hypothetical protein n=1 Tax=Streptomyces sp. NPDC023838 TaxID=3154325 RepID=UPI0033E3B101
MEVTSGDATHAAPGPPNVFRSGGAGGAVEEGGGAAGGRRETPSWPADAIEAFPDVLPGLRASHILDGRGHRVQQERPDEVNRHLTDCLATLPA